MFGVRVGLREAKVLEELGMSERWRMFFWAMMMKGKMDLQVVMMKLMKTRLSSRSHAVEFAEVADHEFLGAFAEMLKNMCR